MSSLASSSSSSFSVAPTVVSIVAVEFSGAISGKVLVSTVFTTSFSIPVVEEKISRAVVVVVDCIVVARMVVSGVGVSVVVVSCVIGWREVVGTPTVKSMVSSTFSAGVDVDDCVNASSSCGDKTVLVKIGCLNCKIVRLVTTKYVYVRFTLYYLIIQLKRLMAKCILQ